MSMIKRAKTGQIEEMMDSTTKKVTASTEDLPVAKDVLEVDKTDHFIDIDLESTDEDEIAVRV